MANLFRQKLEEIDLKNESIKKVNKKQSQKIASFKNPILYSEFSDIWIVNYL